MELPKRASKTQKLHFGAGSCKMELLGGSGQKLNVVLWGVVKSLQKRIEKLEKKKRGRS